MGWRRHFEALAWRLAGFQRPSRVYPTSSIKITANPIELRFQPGDRLLLLSPHPDDEVIGCGGLLGQALAHQAEVWVFYLTDGARGGQAATRRAEVEAVQQYCLRELGRTFTATFGTHQELALDLRAVQQEVAALCRQVSPQYIFLPHEADNHRDHRDTNLALQALAGKLCSQYQVKLLGYEIWNPLRMDAFVDISDQEEFKRQAINLYHSQKRTKDYAAMILALNHYRAACLPGPVRLAEALEIITAP